MKVGMIGRIVNEVCVCTDEEICCDGEVVTMNETFIDEGEFTIEEVLEDEIKIRFKDDPETVWYLSEEDYENVEFV